MTQSQFSLRYIRYIEDAKRYIKQIESFIKECGVDEAKRAKVRTIADIMIKSYEKLIPSVVVDELLIQEARLYYEKFAKLHQKAHREE